MKGQALSPRSPLQSPDSPGGLGSSGMLPRPDRNVAFIDYKRDNSEGSHLDQASGILSGLFLRLTADD